MRPTIMHLYVDPIFVCMSTLVDIWRKLITVQSRLNLSMTFMSSSISSSSVPPPCGRGVAGQRA